MIRNQFAPPTEKPFIMSVYVRRRAAGTALVVTTALIMIFPEIVLWLPNRMK